MSENDVRKLLMLINAYYPTWKPEVEPELIAKAWHNLLRDYSVEDMNKALLMYVSQGNQFPPSNAGVLTSLLVDASESMSDSEAYALVTIAVRNSNYHADEEFANLPEDVQMAVGSPDVLREWAQADIGSRSVRESNFKRSYRAVMERKKEQAKLPLSIRKKIGNEHLQNMQRLQATD